MVEWDIVVVGFTGFCVFFEITVLQPTLLPYIQSLVSDEEQASFVFSVTLSCFAAVQVVSSFSVGYLSRLFGMKPIYLVICCTWILGNVIYAFAEWPLQSAWAIFIGRAFCATGTGLLLYNSHVAPKSIILGLYSIGLSYLSIKITDDTERSKGIATFRALTLFASLPSSVLATILSIPALAFSIGPYTFGPYTYPAWSNIILLLICTSLIIIFVQNLRDQPTKANTHEGAEQATKGKLKFFYISKGCTLGFVILFFNGIVASSLSYAMPVVMYDLYEWSVISYSIVFFVVSILNSGGALSVRVIAKKMKTYRYLVLVPGLGLVVVTSAIGAVSIAGYNTFPEALGVSLYLLSTFGAFGAFQIYHTLLSTLFSSIIPRDFVVRMMPFTHVFYAVGKIVGPLLCEFEAAVFGLPMIYYGLLVMGGTVMFITMIFGKYFHTEDQTHSEIVRDIITQSPILSNNDRDSS